MSEVMTLGVPMVEFTRETPDIPLCEAGNFYGPVAAGDPGITLNACCQLGHRGSYVGVVGKDAFGQCFLNRMAHSGIDTAHVRVHPRLGTGISLLTKFSDGSREFAFTLPDSAAACIAPEDIDDELLGSVRWVHLSGFAMSISESSAQAHLELVRRVGKGVKVSFDPNYRRELLTEEAFVKRCWPVFERCDYFFPSRGEAALFADGGEVEACLTLSRTGKEIALKDGAEGCLLFTRGAVKKQPAFQTAEVDTTGAGDTFDGVLIALTLEGADLFEAGRYAAAAGALAVSRRGLLDAAPAREELDHMIARGCGGN